MRDLPLSGRGGSTEGRDRIYPAAETAGQRKARSQEKRRRKEEEAAGILPRMRGLPDLGRRGIPTATAE